MAYTGKRVFLLLVYLPLYCRAVFFELYHPRHTLQIFTGFVLQGVGGMIYFFLK